MTRFSWRRIPAAGVALASLSLALGCSLRNAEVSATPNQVAITGQRVVTLCNTVQGNGFNWAASLGWMSEVLLLRAGQTKDVEQKNPGVKFLFDLNCVSGSSSGSAVTAMFSSLLANDDLALSRRADGLYLPRDLETLGKALRFMSISVDARLDEFAVFSARFLVPEDSGRGTWWQSRYGAEPILNTLAERIDLARKLKLEDLDLAIDPSFVPEDQAQLKTVVDVPRFSSAIEIPLEESDKSRFERYQSWAREQRRLILDRAWQRMGWNPFAVAKEGRDFLRSQPLPRGMLAATYSLVEYPDAAGKVSVDLQTPPAFSRLRVVVLCNHTTARMILASREYRNAVIVRNPNVMNMVIATVSNLNDAVALSTPEPENQKVVHGWAKDFGIGTIYDPQTDLAENGSPTFALEARSPYLAVAGGWTHFATVAWPLAYYMLARQGNLSQEVDRSSLPPSLPAGMLHGWVGRFGKPARTAQFPPRVMKSYFYRNDDGSEPADPQANVAHYLDLYFGFASDYEKYFNEVFARQRAQIELNWTGFNWDIDKKTAAFAEASQTLLFKAINHTRAKYGDGKFAATNGYTFDPLPDHDYQQ